MTGAISMKDLLDSYPLPIYPKALDTVSGVVTSVRKDGLYVDIGGKTESFCPAEEAGKLSVGDTADFLVLPSFHYFEGAEDGAVLLSHRRALGWSKILSLVQSQLNVLARVISVKRNNTGGVSGLIVSLEGTEAFLPRSEAGVKGPLSEVGSVIAVKVLKADRKSVRGNFFDNVIVSHKAAKAEFLSGLKAGDVVKGEVTQIVFESVSNGNAPRREIGVKMKVADLATGFVYRSETSPYPALQPSEALPVGSIIEATVLAVDAETLELKLSTKQHVDAASLEQKLRDKRANPGREVSQRAAQAEYLSSLKSGDVVKGVVTQIVLESVSNGSGPRREIGVKMKVADLVTGFVYRSETSPYYALQPSEALPVGSTVEATVLAVDAETLELKLSTKQHVDAASLEQKLRDKKANFDREILASLQPGTPVSCVIGYIRRERANAGGKRDFQPGEENGLGVHLPGNLTGMIHRFEVSPIRTVTPSSVLPVGTPVDAEVVSTDDRFGSVRLSLRPMREKELSLLRSQKGQVVAGIVRSAYNNVGYFVSLGLLTEGLLHYRELRMEDGKPQVLEIGSSINVRIKDVTEDPHKRRTTIALGL